MRRFLNYYFTKNDKYTGESYTRSKTIHLSLPSICSFREIIDTLIHEDFHLAFSVENMTERQEHRAMQRMETEFF